jgi:hypothetical protein
MSKCWDATPLPATTWDQHHFVVQQQRCVRRFPTLLLHRGQCLLSCGFLLTVWARPEVTIRYRKEVAIAAINGWHVHCLLLYERSVKWTHNGDVVRSMSKACQWLPTQTSIEIMWVELQICCYQDVLIEHLGSVTGYPKWVPWFQSVTLSSYTGLGMCVYHLSAVSMPKALYIGYYYYYHHHHHPRYLWHEMK